jgi:L-fuconolactonase
MAMTIVDSQVHIWGPETPDKPYFTENASKPHRAKPLGHEELLQVMDANGVQRTVCVPPTWEGFSNEESLRAARLHPDRFAVMGRIAIDKP